MYSRRRKRQARTQLPRLCDGEAGNCLRRWCFNPDRGPRSGGKLIVSTSRLAVAAALKGHLSCTRIGTLTVSASKVFDCDALESTELSDMKL